MSAPVCPVSRDQAVPGMKTPQMPPIPRALDLPSVIAALNQIALLLNPGVNSGQSSGYSISDDITTPGNDGNAKQDNGTSKPRKGWHELYRKIDVVRVQNPVDPEIYVEIPQMTFIKYQEHQTQVKLNWFLLK